MITEQNITPGARTADEVDEATAAANVQSLFNAIAPSYDRLNHLLSFGLDRHWWSATARSFREILAQPEARILDICCGTGDLTAALVGLRPQTSKPVIGLDFSCEMLTRARAKYPDANVLWIEGDAMHLPYDDASLDLVTSAFGFRNLTNYAEALAEIHRVLRPGGQIGILDCNHPTGIRGSFYNLYLHHVLPIVGGWISGERAAYKYLPASIARFPQPPRMKQMLLEAGFSQPAWDGYFLHAAGLYRATKP